MSAFHHGWLDREQVRTLRERSTQVYGEIARLDSGITVHLADGTTPSGRPDHRRGDLLSVPISDPIALSVDGKAVRYEEVERVYRASVIPELPRLVFTGYAMFGFGPLNGYHRAAWRGSASSSRTSRPRICAGSRAARAMRPSCSAAACFLFDGSTNLLATVKETNRRTGRGLYDVRRAQEALSRCGHPSRLRAHRGRGALPLSAAASARLTRAHLVTTGSA
ncbi:MAG: hypothetical protein U5L05_18140 [Rubrivivax sp.]|nr:hypothetical protein [Rubrivivax sp.]